MLTSFECEEVERRIFLAMPFSIARENLCNAILNGGTVDDECERCSELQEDIHDLEQQVRDAEDANAIVDVEKSLLQIMGVPCS